MKGIYTFYAQVWLYPGSGGWHFVSLPKKLASQIKKEFSENAKAWGSLSTWVTVGKTRWKTSLFPDTKTNTYLLPIKAVVRQREQVKKDQRVKVSLEFEI